MPTEAEQPHIASTNLSRRQIFRIAVEAGARIAEAATVGKLGLSASDSTIVTTDCKPLKGPEVMVIRHTLVEEQLPAPPGPELMPAEDGVWAKFHFQTPVPENEERYIKRLARRNDLSEISGRFPADRFQFKPTIAQFGLIPEVVAADAPIAAYLTAGRDYIECFRDMLLAYPQYRGPTFAELGMLRAENYPIDLSEDDDLLSLSTRFLTDYGTGIQYLPEPSIDDRYSMQFRWRLVQEEKDYLVSGKVATSYAIASDRERIEEKGQVYYQYATPQIAAKMLHEYTHYLQAWGLVKAVQSRPDYIRRIYGDINEVMARVNKLETVRQYQFEEMLVENVGLKLKEAATLSPKEAQANMPPLLMQHQLAIANDAARFPGLGDDNPFAVGGPTLYETFLKTLPQLDRPANPFFLHWLKWHNW